MATIYGNNLTKIGIPFSYKYLFESLKAALK